MELCSLLSTNYFNPQTTLHYFLHRPCSGPQWQSTGVFWLEELSVGCYLGERKHVGDESEVILKFISRVALSELLKSY